MIDPNTKREPTAKRRYVLKDRAERLAETRRRIVEAAVTLHREVGPALTHVSEIARRAGVERATVYSHFPDDEMLFGACSAHWRELHPAPDPQQWVKVTDPGKRLRLALGHIYAWYRETAPVTRNVLRDAQTLPALQRVIQGGLLPYLELIASTVAEPFKARGRRRERILHAARAAVDFHFWEALAPLGDATAAELGAGLVEHAWRARVR